MSFDGIFTYGILQELDNALTSGRIAKVYQPFPNELILQVRAKGKIESYLFQLTPITHAFTLQMKHMKTRLNRQCFACFFVNI